MPHKKHFSVSHHLLDELPLSHTNSGVGVLKPLYSRMVLFAVDPSPCKDAADSDYPPSPGHSCITTTMNKPTLTRSKIFESVESPSRSNASWERSDSERTTGIQSISQPPQISWARQSKTHSLPLLCGIPKFAAIQRSERNSAPLPISETMKKPNDGDPSDDVPVVSYFDDEKVERLLKRLRTDKFAGTIDLEHHAQYLLPPNYKGNNRTDGALEFKLSNSSQKRKAQSVNELTSCFM